MSKIHSPRIHSDAFCSKWMLCAQIHYTKTFTKVLLDALKPHNGIFLFGYCVHTSQGATVSQWQGPSILCK